jgi:hypothetical protein
MKTQSFICALEFPKMPYFGVVVPETAGSSPVTRPIRQQPDSLIGVSFTLLGDGMHQVRKTRALVRPGSSSSRLGGA